MNIKLVGKNKFSGQTLTDLTPDGSVYFFQSHACNLYMSSVKYCKKITRSMNTCVSNLQK